MWIVYVNAFWYDLQGFTQIYLSTLTLYALVGVDLGHDLPPAFLGVGFVVVGSAGGVVLPLLALPALGLLDLSRWSFDVPLEGLPPMLITYFLKKRNHSKRVNRAIMINVIAITRGIIHHTGSGPAKH